MDVPRELRLALAAELATVGPKELAASVAELSARYRNLEVEPAGPLRGAEPRFGEPPHGGATEGDEAPDGIKADPARLPPSIGVERDQPLVRSEREVAAYTAYRMPATFAAVHAALKALHASAPELRPASLLDVGAGPGTASWAAAQLWPELGHTTLLERDERMIALGRRLARHATAPSLRDATWRRVDVADQDWDAEPSSLVIAAYVLGEVAPAERDDFVARLWAHATDALVIVEPGTPRGFAAIRQARAVLIAHGATIAAPCPHDEACPMPAGDWCHFAQRVARTPLHRGAKAATLAYEDEKFSYVAATHGAAGVRAPRVLRHPQTRKGHIIFELCTPAGLQRRTVSRKEGALYRQARDATWGSTLDVPTDT